MRVSRGFAALALVGTGAACAVVYVHKLQTEERRVSSSPSRAQCPPASDMIACMCPLRVSFQTMRQAVLRDIEKLGR